MMMKSNRSQCSGARAAEEEADVFALGQGQGGGDMGVGLPLIHAPGAGHGFVPEVIRHADGAEAVRLRVTKDPLQGLGVPLLPGAGGEIGVNMKVVIDKCHDCFPFV